MQAFTRRELVLGATAVAALGLSGRVVLAQNADPAARKGTFDYKIGDIEVTGVHDGFFQMPVGDGFIENATVPEIKEALQAGGLPPDQLTINIAQTLLKAGDRTVLVDTGTGGQLAPTAGAMAENLANAGIAPAGIDTVVISHFHPDHIFGLMGKENGQTFPNAEILVPEAELAFWTDPATLSSMPQDRRGLVERIVATLGTWDNVRPFKDGEELAPGVVARAAYGHTPGHMAFVIGSGDDQLVIASDSANIPALFVRHPGWHVMFDMDKAMAEAARRKLFDQVVADGATIAGSHFGFPNAGTLQKDGEGYIFEPMVAA